MDQQVPILYYDEVLDLLGGADWNHALKEWILAGLSEDRKKKLDALGPLLSGPQQFLSSGETDGNFPLEVLWLKWHLFVELCSSVWQFHKENRAPILALNPKQVKLQFHGFTGQFFPFRWAFSMVHPNYTAATAFHNDAWPSHSPQRIFEIPGDRQYLYDPPAMQGPALGHEETVTVLIRSLERVRRSDQKSIQGLIEIHLVTENIRPQDYSDKDLFALECSLPSSSGSTVQVLAVKKASQERGLLLEGKTDPLPPPVWQALDQAKKSVFSGSKVKIYRSYHVPCDLYSLGMVLLRTLLVNDQQNLSSVSESANRLVDGLEPMVSGLDPKARGDLYKRLKHRLLDEDDWWLKSSVLYRKEDREKKAKSIPSDIWLMALQLAFRLISFIPNFSFSRDRGDYSLDDPGSKMEIVAQEARWIERMIHAELFGSKQRNREILEVCDVVREELDLAEAG